MLSDAERRRLAEIERDLKAQDPSFAERLSLVSKYKLRGYSVWVLGQEDPAVWKLPAVRQ